MKILNNSKCIGIRICFLLHENIFVNIHGICMESLNIVWKEGERLGLCNETIEYSAGQKRNGQRIIHGS